MGTSGEAAISSGAPGLGDGPAARGGASGPGGPASSGFGPLVDAAWLDAHLGQVVVADVRWYLDGRSGRAAYASGHIPGAVFVDLDTVLADPSSPARGRHPLPAPQRFAAGLGALGIGDADTVVAYDDAGRFLAPERLRSRFGAAGSGPAPIVYCGSGVTACHVLLALEAAGLGHGRLYAGSWSQWSADPRRPAARGS